MIVAGVMSGTSADGINVALVKFPDGRSRNRTPFELIGHAEYPFPARVRRTILQLMNSTSARVADLAQLNFLLGHLYAEAVQKTKRRFHPKVDLVGCHGQTLYHQGTARNFLGRKLAVTWQTGEATVIAARLDVPVVSDFRPADMAAGGKGAPLVPFLDYALFRDPRAGRIVQNIGGIANLTAIPPAARADQVLAFDTGPGNMVIDALAQRFFHKSYDRDGKIAAKGRILTSVVTEILKAPFFRSRPPKTAGREEFGKEFVGQFIRQCGRAEKTDVFATATALTSASIAQAIRKFVITPRSKFRDFIASGGGTRNTTLMAMLRRDLEPLGLRVHTTDEFGLPSEAKEAAAFALLAYETWHRRPSNVPSATGASRAAILGKISYA
jgi:anhydro-N-acetylmuramic acid kinase